VNVEFGGDTGTVKYYPDELGSLPVKPDLATNCTGTPQSSHPKIIISGRHLIPKVFITAAENIPFQYLLEVR
jgi:hypothetical protein